MMMKKENTTRPLRLALAALFWVAAWQVVAMAVGQGILLASPVDTLARLVALVQTGGYWRSVLFTLCAGLGGGHRAGDPGGAMRCGGRPARAAAVGHAVGACGLLRDRGADLGALPAA